jgi:hypothetical protein
MGERYATLRTERPYRENRKKGERFRTGRTLNTVMQVDNVGWGDGGTGVLGKAAP